MYFLRKSIFNKIVKYQQLLVHIEWIKLRHYSHLLHFRKPTYMEYDVCRFVNRVSVTNDCNGILVCKTFTVYSFIVLFYVVLVDQGTRYICTVRVDGAEPSADVSVSCGASAPRATIPLGLLESLLSLQKLQSGMQQSFYILRSYVKIRSTKKQIFSSTQ